MGEYKVMALIVNEIHAAMYHMQEVEALFHAISQLTMGTLSHQLVGVSTMRAKLRSVNTVLKNDSPPGMEYQLLHEDVSYYYHQAIVKGAIHTDRHYEKTLFVIIHAPITHATLQQSLTMWKLKPFPLRSPAEQTYYTLLTTDFKFVLYDENNPYYLTAKSQEDLPFSGVTNLININDPSITLHKSSIPSCAIALFGTNLSSIKTLCEYHVIFTELKTEIFRITANKLLLNNVTSLRVSRKGREDVRPINKIITVREAQTFYSIPCEATVEVANQVFVSSEVCDHAIQQNFDSNLSFPINMLVLRQYFDNNELLADCNAILDMNSSISAKLPQLQVERPAYNRRLAKQEEYRYDFQEVINQSQSNEKLYDSLAHVVYADMLATANAKLFNEFDIFHWLALISTVVAGINLVAVCLLYFRFKALSILFLSAPKVNGFQEFVYTTPSISHATSLDFHQIWLRGQEIMATYISVEILLSLIFLLLLLKTTIQIYRYFIKTVKYHTILRLDLEGGDTTYSRVVLKLQYSPNCYRFDIQNGDLRITPAKFFPRLEWGQSVKIKDPRQQILTFEHAILIWPWQISTVNQILADSHYTAVLTVFDKDNSLVDLLLLRLPKNAHFRQQNAERDIEKQNLPLYPTLSSMEQ